MDGQSSEYPLQDAATDAGGRSDVANENENFDKNVCGVKGGPSDSGDDGSGESFPNEAVPRGMTENPLFRVLADHAPVMIWIAGTDGLCFYFNKPWLDFSGQTFEHEYGDGWARGVHEDDFAGCLATYREAFAARRKFAMTYRLRRHDGPYRWILDNGVPWFDPQGEFAGYIGSCIDVTEMKHAEAEIRKSESRFRTITECVPLGIYFADSEGKCIFVNSKYEELAGRSAAEMLDDGWHEALHPEDRDRVVSAWTRMVEEHAEFEEVYRYCRPNGAVVWVRAWLSRIALDDDQWGYLGALQDLTREKQAELELEAGRRFLKRLADANPALIFVYDFVLMRMVFVNASVRRVLGVETDEFLGWSLDDWDARIVPADQDVVRRHRAMWRGLADEMTLEVEYRYNTRVQGQRWLRSCDAIFQRDACGSPRQVLCTVLDVTQEKRNATDRNRLAGILEASSDVVAMVNPSGRLIWVNQAARLRMGMGVGTLSEIGKVRDVSAPIAGVVSEEHPGPHIHSWHPQWARDRLETEALPTARRLGTWVGESALLLPNGKECPVSQLILAHNDHTGNLLHYALICRDITELMDARNAAEAANRAKSAFLANMSHEIRTPMTAILGYSEILGDPSLPEDEFQEIASRIQRNGKHLLQIINDILDLSKIEAERLDLDCVEYDPWQAVEEVLSMLGGTLMHNTTRFRATAITRLPRWVYTDPLRLRQVIFNLVSNALKFTHEGEVIVTIAFAPDDKSRAIAASPSFSPSPSPSSDPFDADPKGICGWIQYQVSDTGVGMSPEQLSEIFQPFYQADPTTTRLYGGTGLGLMISRKLAQKLGGDITVESRLGVGSTFRLTLPVKARGPLRLIGAGIGRLPVYDSCSRSNGNKDNPAENANPRVVAGTDATLPTPEISAGMLQGSVLVVEDNPDNASVIEHFLNRFGLAPVIAADGLEAMDCIRARETPFDLIFMDIQMPRMDGWSALASLIKRNYPGPIVAVTAHTMSGEREKCLRAGFHGYISKPINLVELEQTLRKFFAPAENVSS